MKQRIQRYSPGPGRAAAQRGGVIVLVCFVLIFLLGFAGITLDFGRLFVVRSELQTAMDSCALAAAQELDGQPTALERARSAGVTAANLNRVNLQSADWDGKGQVTDDDIVFLTATLAETTDWATAKYAACEHAQPDVRIWILHAMNAFMGSGAATNPTSNPTARTVWARAVATRGSSQTTCPIPVGLRPRVGGVAPDYGFQVGEWITIYGKQLGAGPGEMGWYNLDGSSNAAETAKELGEGGSCGTRIGDVLGTPGAQTSAHGPWNYRFGIYKNNEGPSEHHPDETGYAYTAVNWKNPVPQNAFAGQPAAGSHPSAENYIAKRAKYASFADTGTDLKEGSLIAFGDKNKLNSFKSIATPGVNGEHKAHGYNRRLAVVPVLNDAAKVIDYACVFMLAPMSGPNDDVQLEYRGNAGEVDSPCKTNGLPGGSAGPLIPVLVR